MPKTIKQLREERGWTQQELAGKLGVAISTVYQWERGKYEPRFSQMKALCLAFGITMNDFIPSDMDLDQVDQGKAAALGLGQESDTREIVVQIQRRTAVPRQTVRIIRPEEQGP